MNDNTQQNNGAAPAPFQILALSGGGYRGLFTARVLEKLEEQAGKPIGQCFDLICGTSIGGIIAMGLGLEIPAATIARTIRDEGANIFSKKGKGFGRYISAIPLLGLLPYARYGNANLRNITERILGDRTIGDSKHRLLITSVNYMTGRPQMFKTRHHPSFHFDHKMPMLEAAMATSAAPTYFPIWQNKETRQTYLDGGLVANAPGLLGVHEARHFLGQRQKNIRLLSIGTMGEDVRFEKTADLDRGIWWWGKRIFSVTAAAQESLTDYMLGHMLGDNYRYINVSPKGEDAKKLGLDRTGKESTDLLIGQATKAAQDALGKPELSKMLSHNATPYFYP